MCVCVFFFPNVVAHILYLCIGFAFMYSLVYVYTDLLPKFAVFGPRRRLKSIRAKGHSFESMTGLSDRTSASIRRSAPE